MFRVEVLVQHSESSCLSFVRFITIFLHYGVQSHWAHSFGPVKSFLSFNFGVQSRFSYPFMHFESSPFLVLTFRTIVLFCIQCHRHSLVWRSEPLYVFIQGPWVTIFPCFDIQSHVPSIVSFRVTVLTFVFLSITHLAFRVCIYPRFPHRVTLCLSLIRHYYSRIHFSLLMT